MTARRVTQKDIDRYNPEVRVFRWCETHSRVEKRVSNLLHLEGETVEDAIALIRFNALYPGVRTVRLRRPGNNRRQRMCDARLGVDVEDSYGDTSAEVWISGWLPFDEADRRNYWLKRPEWERKVKAEQDATAARLKKERPDLFEA